MRKRPTIHDVASAAGVSVTTVSDALSGKGRVDSATRTRVAEVVRRLGYQANRHARGLRSGRSGAIGLLLPVGADVRTDEALSLDVYMRLSSAAAATTFSHQQALMLLPPTITLNGLREFALDGGIIVDPSERDADQPVRTSRPARGYDRARPRQTADLGADVPARCRRDGIRYPGARQR